MTKLNQPLIRQALLVAQSNLRQVGGHTKTRGEVRGGGKKPHRQKGTGAARAGTRRSPIWSGGGITFGSRKEQNFKRNLPTKMKLAALAQLLKLKYDEQDVVVIDSIALKEAKTKNALKLLTDHNIADQRVLMITQTIEPELIMASRNLPKATVITNDHLDILALANAQKIIMEKSVAVSRGLVVEKKAPASTKKPTKAAKRTS